MTKVDDEQYLVSKKELEKANKEIAELELYSRQMAQQIMVQSKRSKKMIEEISDLKKENEELKTGLKRLEIKGKQILKEAQEHLDLDKLREQEIERLRFQLANAESETLDKVIAEIEKHENPYPKDVFVWDNKEKLDFNRGRFNQHCFEIVENTKNELKSALLSMKKETKT